MQIELEYIEQTALLLFDISRRFANVIFVVYFYCPKPEKRKYNSRMGRQQIQFYRKIHYLTREFHDKFHAKNRYRTNREAMSAISVFQVKFNVEFTSQVIDFP